MVCGLGWEGLTAQWSRTVVPLVGTAWSSQACRARRGRCSGLGGGGREGRGSEAQISYPSKTLSIKNNVVPLTSGAES